MLTLEKIIVLRVSDLKRFFNVEDFWNQKEAFFEIVNHRGINIFFDSEKEKDCYSLFYKWHTDKDHLQIEVKNDTLYAQIGLIDKKFDLGRLSSAFYSHSNSISLKDRIGISLMYLMLGADELQSEIVINYDFFASIRDSKNEIPQGEFVIRYENWVLPEVEIAFPLSRKIIANKSGHSICITKGCQSEILQPQECIIGLFTSSGCCRLLPHHIISPDGGLQLRLICGKKWADVEVHTPDSYHVINDVKSIILEADNTPVFLKENGELVFDESCFAIKSKYDVFTHHYGKSNLIAVEKISKQVLFYSKDNKPF